MREYTPSPQASPEVRQALELHQYLKPEDMIVRKKGRSNDGREALEVDETLIYSLLRGMKQIQINVSPNCTDDRKHTIAYGYYEPTTLTTWTGERVIANGRQRRKAAIEINARVQMLVAERAKDPTYADHATFRNYIVGTKTVLSPKAWGWASDEAINLYLGGRVGDAKQGFDAPGLFTADGTPIIYHLWCVYQDIDPESPQMWELSTSTEFGRIKTPPSRLAARIANMLQDLPRAHVARLLGDIDDRTLTNRMMILQVEKAVQAAVDLGDGKPGGISWTQMRDNFFQAGKGGKLVPLAPEDQIALLGKLAGSSVRGGGSAKQKEARAAAKGAASGKTPTPVSAATTAPAAPASKAPEPTAGHVVVKLKPELLSKAAGALEKAADTMADADQLDNKQDLLAMAAALRYFTGDSGALKEYPIAHDLLTALLAKIGGDGATIAPVASAATEKTEDPSVMMGVKILDLNEAWRKSRKHGPVVNGLVTFEPNWPQGEGLSAGLVDMLTKCQAQYRKHEADSLTDGKTPTAADEFIEEWVTSELLAMKPAEGPVSPFA